jgi:hypothetical protein
VLGLTVLYHATSLHVQKRCFFRFDRWPDLTCLAYLACLVSFFFPSPLPCSHGPRPHPPGVPLSASFLHSLHISVTSLFYPSLIFSSLNLALPPFSTLTSNSNSSLPSMLKFVKEGALDLLAFTLPSSLLESIRQVSEDDFLAPQLSHRQRQPRPRNSSSNSSSSHRSVAAARRGPRLQNSDSSVMQMPPLLGNQWIQLCYMPRPFFKSTTSH